MGWRSRICLVNSVFRFPKSARSGCDCRGRSVSGIYQKVLQTMQISAPKLAALAAAIGCMRALSRHALLFPVAIGASPAIVKAETVSHQKRPHQIARNAIERRRKRSTKLIDILPLITVCLHPVEQAES